MVQGRFTLQPWRIGYRLRIRACRAAGCFCADVRCASYGWGVYAGYRTDMAVVCAWGPHNVGYRAWKRAFKNGDDLNN